MINNYLKFGLMGHPITHSKSPALFKAAYPNSSMTYDLIEAETVEVAMEKFNEQAYSGANITSPYKDQIMDYITHPDTVSNLVRSANVIIKKDDGLYSYNSDYYGVKNSVVEYLACQNDKTVKSALVVGAGGAGKAAVLALKDLGYKVYLANRSVEKALDFVKRVNSKNIEVIRLGEINEISGSIDLICYTLSFKIGEIDLSLWKNKIVFEANYANPQLLPLNNEYQYISGKEWLFHQAIPAFKIFSGQEPDKKAMWEVL